MSSFADYAQRKIERFRMGQAAYETVSMLSDPEVRVSLVPLTEAEYSNSLNEADKVMAGENAAGIAYREEVQRKHILFHACRVADKPEVKFFSSPQEVGELDYTDISFLFDNYLEMTAKVSPSMMGIPEAEFDDLKKALQEIQWSELSGSQWYAAQRFVNSIQTLLHMDRSSGFHSTTPSTPTSIEQDSVESV